MPTTLSYIQFVCRPRTIHHAPIYHLNIIPWSYTPPALLLIHTTMPHRPTSQHLRPLPYSTKLSRDHLTALSHLLRVDQCLRLSVTPISAGFLPDWLLNSQTGTVQLYGAEKVITWKRRQFQVRLNRARQVAIICSDADWPRAIEWLEHEIDQLIPAKHKLFDILVQHHARQRLQ